MTRDPHSSLCLPWLLVAAVLIGVAKVSCDLIEGERTGESE